jgi:hypothetical protein
MPSYRCCRIAATEIGMGYYALPAQRELFPRGAAATTSLPPAVIERLLLLVIELLVETAVIELAVTERIDEQQDHA